MKRKIIHQWRDWLLEKIGDDRYELIQKDNLSVVEIVAKNAMDAENQSQQIIKKAREEVI
jgi:hypothetical protein